MCLAQVACALRDNLLQFDLPFHHHLHAPAVEQVDDHHRQDDVDGDGSLALFERRRQRHGFPVALDDVAEGVEGPHLNEVFAVGHAAEVQRLVFAPGAPVVVEMETVAVERASDEIGVVGGHRDVEVAIVFRAGADVDLRSFGLRLGRFVQIEAYQSERAAQPGHIAVHGDVLYVRAVECVKPFPLQGRQLVVQHPQTQVAGTALPAASALVGVVQQSRQAFVLTFDKRRAPALRPIGVAIGVGGPHAVFFALGEAVNIGDVVRFFRVSTVEVALEHAVHRAEEEALFVEDVERKSVAAGVEWLHLVIVDEYAVGRSDQHLAVGRGGQLATGLVDELHAAEALVLSHEQALQRAGKEAVPVHEHGVHLSPEAVLIGELRIDLRDGDVEESVLRRAPHGAVFVVAE